MNGPLDGISVLDFSTFVSGPMATQILADQGAVVVKVEPPGLGDLSRILGHRVGTVSALYAACNRGKRSVVLDLRADGGPDIARELAAQADVVVQNWRPGVAERLGIGPDELVEANPELIVASITGVGPDGPDAGRKAFDALIQAKSGVAAIQRTGGQADLVHTLLCDKTTAMFAAQAITAALVARERGAGGQVLDLSMLDAMMYWLWPDAYSAHTLMGDKVVAGANFGRGVRLQPTADGHLAYMVTSDSEWRGLVDALGHPEWWDDPRFSDSSMRSHRDHLRVILPMVDQAFRTWSTDELIERLYERDVPVSAVSSLDEAIDDPQVVHNATLEVFDHPAAGPVRLPRPPTDFTVTAADFVVDVDTLGASTDDVLLDHGISFERLRALKADGIVGA